MVTQYFTGYLQPAMFVLYGFLILASISFFVSTVCKAKGWLAATIGHISFVLCSICGVVWMTATSLIADWCDPNPTINILESIGTRDLQRYFIWYATCNPELGSSPLFNIINYSISVNQYINQTIAGNRSYYGNDDYTLIQTDAVNNIHQLNMALDTSACKPFQQEWFSTINDNLCGTLYNGVYDVWVAQITSCLLLFFIIITSSVVSHRRYFNGISPEYAEQYAEVQEQEMALRKQQQEEADV